MKLVMSQITQKRQWDVCEWAALPGQMGPTRGHSDKTGMTLSMGTDDQKASHPPTRPHIHLPLAPAPTAL